MPQNDVNLLMQSYVNKQIKLYYYNKDLISIAVKTNFDVGDYIYAKANDNTVLMNGKYFLFDRGAFGECTKTRAVKFMIPHEPVSCGFKIVSYFLILEKFEQL